MWYLTSGVFNFWKHKNIIKFLDDMKIPIQSQMMFFIAKPSTYATCYLIELCQIVVTLSEIYFILPWSRSRTRFHHMQCFYTRIKQAPIHPQNKNCMLHYDTSLVKKLHQGYGAMQKGIKRCIPKEGMPHASSCQKKE